MESISSFILVGATIIIGIVLFSLFASYGAIYSAKTIALQDAQYYSAGVRVTSGSPVGNQVPVIICNYNDKDGRLILVSFFIKPCYVKSASEIEPACFALINSTAPSEINAEVLGLSNCIVYNGILKGYKANTGNLEMVCIKPGYYTELWIIMKVDCQFYRIGYYVID
ncbi:hypothetical protein [Acidianus sp. HS-5]|uniref:hypothetical protein n=1 Tax=Acidianus sp. HS-5 TaxID=2886040 RepID=UPI001F39D1E8|nr:hypothetical protein [Acidianus sp. HS-5]BDC19514.1 hypothetical protein HS5_24040 [Acidianus sp. HS-5]